jgi:hypothetical protein
VLEVGPQGCLVVRLTEPSSDTADRWTVWPPGADIVHGSVGAGEEGGGYFRSSGQYCDALVGGVLVIDDVRPA